MTTSAATASGLVPPEHSIEYPHVERGLDLVRGRRAVVDLDARVVVVGTGAGGAPAAASLAEDGLDVLMLEEGALRPTQTFTTDAVQSLQTLYRDAGTSAILGRPPILFAEGRCVGGSTVINGGMSWRTPESVLRNWSEDLHLPDTSPEFLSDYFDRAEKILHVEHQHPDTPGRNDERFVAGAAALGWNARDNPRNMHRCVGLNNCAFGCPTGAKRSMLVTEIPRALQAGARLVTHARVDRLRFRGKAVVAVEGSFVDRYGRVAGRFRVRTRMVVLAAGARHTPGILLRSRVRLPRLGRGLRVHPNAKVVGVFKDSLDPSRGAHQSHQIHDFLNEGVLLGYAAVPPGLLAAGLPGFGDSHAQKMLGYDRMLTAACLIEDTGEGRVFLGPDRQPQMMFRLSDADVETIHLGVRKAAELMFAAGASSVLLPFADLPELRSVDQLALIDSHPRRRSGIELMTVHIMGSTALSLVPGTGVCDAFGRVHGRSGVVVADAGLFPSSIGVNPMETIVALSLRGTDRWKQDLRAGGGAHVLKK